MKHLSGAARVDAANTDVTAAPVVVLLDESAYGFPSQIVKEIDPADQHYALEQTDFAAAERLPHTIWFH